MRKILVVDDSLFQRKNICSVLRDAGYKTIEAENGRDGLDKALSASPDCILTDLLMPEMDGIAFMSALREKGVSPPVFVLTADIQESKRKKCLEMGAAGFLSKPLRKDDLLEAFRGLPAPGKGE